MWSFGVAMMCLDRLPRTGVSGASFRMCAGGFKSSSALFLIAALLSALAGCGRGTRPVTNQVVVLGFDGSDPKLAAKWMAEGKLPNLKHLADTGTFRPLGTTNPPESPGAWASFATGLNPGETGIFDFLTRDPQTSLPEPALASREKPKFLFGEIPIKRPHMTN